MSGQDPLQPLLAEQPVAILDGGLATTLAEDGADLSGRLWSARLLHEDPGRMRDLHAAFLRAGADVVVTGSYQATLTGLTELGVTRSQAAGLLVESVRLARRATTAAGRPDALVAASVGPWAATFGDGSEYTGYEDADGRRLADAHRERLRILAGAGPDLLAIETLPSAVEARALLELLSELDTPPAWMTFTAGGLTGRRDGADTPRITDGTPLASIASEVAEHPAVVAVGVNCTPPERIPALLRSLPADLPARVAVYPNLGSRWDATEDRWRRDGPDTIRRTPDWRELGAELIGGCCGTRPADIARLRRHLLDHPVPAS